MFSAESFDSVGTGTFVEPPAKREGGVGVPVLATTWPSIISKPSLTFDATTPELVPKSLKAPAFTFTSGITTPVVFPAFKPDICGSLRIGFSNSTGDMLGVPVKFGPFAVASA